MKRWLLCAALLLLSGSAVARFHGGVAGGGGGGKSLVFNLASGFPAGACNSACTLYSIFGRTVSGNVVEITDGLSEHQAANVWYPSQLNVNSFTTEFTFQNQEEGGVPGLGMVFILSPPQTINSNGGGLMNAGDANGIGYFCYQNCPNNPAVQQRFYDTVAITFDMSGDNFFGYLGGSPQMTGLYLNGGPAIDYGMGQKQGLVGVNMYLGDIMDAYITYDGTTLTEVLTDTSTSAKVRYAWPVNIPAVCNCTTAYAGLGAGNVNPATMPATQQTINSWVWYSGVDTQLTAPTFSVSAGQYTSTQSVSITCPSGATCYYTTNGTEPTTASTQYTGTAVSIAATKELKAVATESNFRDSPIATSFYQICTGCTYPVDFSGGFTSYSGILNLVGNTALSGSAIHLANASFPTQNGSGAVWNIAPVAINGSWSTTFTVQFTNISSPQYDGLAFVLQNYLPGSADTTAPQIFGTGAGPVSGGCNVGSPTYPSPGGPCGSSVSGGPLALGEASGTDSAAPFLGYYGMGESVAVKFDLSNNTTGVLTDGQAASNASTTPTGISLISGDPIQVTISYNGSGTLSETLEDTTTMTTFGPTTFSVNIPSVVGGNSAYAGFTAADGYTNTLQAITSWKMN